MDEESLIKIILLTILLIFSAFFSGAETAIFSLTILDREKLKTKSGARIKRFLNLIIKNPDSILITILTGNMIVNVFAIAIYDSLFPVKESIISALIPIISMTALLLIIGEMTPKNFAVRSSLSFTRIAALPLYAIHFILSPLRFVLNSIRKALSVKIKKNAAEDDMLNSTITIGYKEGIINQLEFSLFESFFDFNNMTAADVMLPRTEIYGVDISTDINKLIRDINNSGKEAKHSLILVYKGDIDNPLGYIDIKDLLPYKLGMANSQNLSQILRSLHSIPESKKLNQLMKEMKDKNHGMAIVVDEYGGTSGVITFQNMIKSILSYFYTSGEDSIEQIEQGIFHIPGSLEIKILNEFLNLNIIAESRTVAGMIIENMGEIPQEGRAVKIMGVVFTVLNMFKNRIIKVKAEIK